ncbi:MAG: hypothetical protein HUJ13_04405 [Hydrogenovibrio crunogenus]|nr:hypothetical protein [Hydrogenovibrio crunogenus]
MPKNKALLLLVAAWVVGFIGALLGLLFDPNWFSRFGSLVVLLAVMSEYTLLHGELARLYTKLDQISAEDDIPDLSPSRWHRKKFQMTHLTVILGTFIWGFGDLVFPF